MAQDRSIFITQFDLDRLTRVINAYSPQNDFDQENMERLLYDLERATIVDSKDVPANIVTMNSKVYLRDVDSEQETIFTLVFPQDADMAENKVSVLAPVGSAVLGYKAGDIIEWKVPARIKRLKIESVIYQPEAAGNYHL
jgi:regulator of nucleoside diphosphate kinase